eukprot:Phypoly_transcript_08604.p1 GENE.Phypoly_transcript_08604~~Phypoly_transcript_08604.p1  ORF type:complete len:423 (+),score=46.51 Phypoly_transcript_08604:216-1484(+)
MLAGRHLVRFMRPPLAHEFGGLVNALSMKAKLPGNGGSKRTTWYRGPDIKGEKEGTASSLVVPLLVAFGFLGFGVLVWKWDKKRQLKNLLAYSEETVLKCEECQREIPRGAKIVEEGIERWAYCPGCKKMSFVFEQPRVPKCRECNTAIVSGKYSTNLRNDVYCNTHTKKPHKVCFFCSRFIYTNKPERPSSTFKIHSCSECRANKMPKDKIQSAAEHVRKVLKDGYGFDFKENVTYYVSMVRRMPTKLKFTQGIPGEHRSTIGQTTTKMSSLFNPFRKDNSWTGDIKILEGYDTTGFEMVLAHELGHVYIKSNKIKFPPDVEEGLCNLLSYLYLRQMCKTTDATPQMKEQLRFYMRQMEKDVDDVYGEGFRKVFNIYFNVRNKTKTDVDFSQFLDILHSNYGTRMNAFSYPTSRSPSKALQ